jgi:hypothetical protein
LSPHDHLSQSLSNGTRAAFVLVETIAPQPRGRPQFSDWNTQSLSTVQACGFSTAASILSLMPGHSVAPQPASDATRITAINVRIVVSVARCGCPDRLSWVGGLVYVGFE